MGKLMSSVLIIDDEKGLLLVMRQALESHGYKVITATNGTEGIRVFNQMSLDLVITDVRMPGMDGHDVVQHIRYSEQSTPVIGISGTPWDLNNSDFSAVLSKPFSLKTLVDTVNGLAAKSIRLKKTEQHSDRIPYRKTG